MTGLNSFYLLKTIVSTKILKSSPTEFVNYQVILKKNLFGKANTIRDKWKGFEKTVTIMYVLSRAGIIISPVEVLIFYYFCG